MKHVAVALFPYISNTSIQLEKELKSFYRKHLENKVNLTVVHKTCKIKDYFKYKDKQPVVV